MDAPATSQASLAVPTFLTSVDLFELLGCLGRTPVDCQWPFGSLTWILKSTIWIGKSSTSGECSSIFSIHCCSPKGILKYQVQNVQDIYTTANSHVVSITYDRGMLQNTWIKTCFPRWWMMMGHRLSRSETPNRHCQYLSIWFMNVYDVFPPMCEKPEGIPNQKMIRSGSSTGRTRAPHRHCESVARHRCGAIGFTYGRQSAAKVVPSVGLIHLSVEMSHQMGSSAVLGISNDTWYQLIPVLFSKVLAKKNPKWPSQKLPQSTGKAKVFLCFSPGPGPLANDDPCSQCSRCRPTSCQMEDWL